MSILLRDQWKTWAQDWNLSHHPEKGWVNRTEHVVGERNGLMFRVAWGSDADPGLHVTIRFPRTADTGRLLQALVADATLDALPGKGAARAKMELQLGPPKAIRWGPRSEFSLSDTALLWRRTFAFRVPDSHKIRAWVEVLLAAVARATPAFAGRCESCTGSASGYVLVDGLPTLLCPPCQQRLRFEGEMAERSYDLIETRHLRGLAFAVPAALAGGMAWGGIAALTERIFAAAAIGIGALVAWAYRQGAGRVDRAGQLLASVLTLASVVFGEILLYAFWVMRAQPQLGFRVDLGWAVYQRSWTENPGNEVASVLFALVGAWVASQALARPKLHAKVEEAKTSDETRRAA